LSCAACEELAVGGGAIAVDGADHGLLFDIRAQFILEDSFELLYLRLNDRHTITPLWIILVVESDLSQVVMDLAL
jgi:hypothetical protein